MLKGIRFKLNIQSTVHLFQFRIKKYFILLIVVHNYSSAEVCDATTADSSIAARQQKKLNSKIKMIVITATRIKCSLAKRALIITFQILSDG